MKTEIDRVKTSPFISIVTGASSGIGEAYAWELATERRSHLVLVARRADRLEQLAKRIKAAWVEQGYHAGRIAICPADLTVESERDRFVEEFHALGWELDLLVNNAGFGTLGEFSQSDRKKQLEMIQLNCLAPVHLLHAFLPGMIRRGRGTVINVCSTGAFQPLTYMTTYGATKAFLCSFSLAAAKEVSRAGVLIMAHCPGPTATEFHVAAGLPTKINYLTSMDARRVVHEALIAMDRQSILVINGLGNKLLAIVARCLSPRLTAGIVERLLRPYAVLARQTAGDSR